MCFPATSDPFIEEVNEQEGVMELRFEEHSGGRMQPSDLEEAPERASGSQDGPNVTEDLVSSPSSCVAPTCPCP